MIYCPNWTVISLHVAATILLHPPTLEFVQDLNFKYVCSTWHDLYRVVHILIGIFVYFIIRFNHIAQIGKKMWFQRNSTNVDLDTHCCIKCPQNLQVKTLLQKYTAFTCRIYNETLKISSYMHIVFYHWHSLITLMLILFCPKLL